MSIKGKITYKQLITKVKNVSSVDNLKELIQSHVVVKYVDYQTKLTEINRIAEVGNYYSAPDPEDSNVEKRIFHRNTPAMYYLMQLRLVINYTDIEIDEDNGMLEAYNALSEMGIIDAIVASIPETEVVQWQKMLDMVNDDIYMNERDMASYLDTKLDATKLVLNMMTNQLGELVNRLEGANTTEDTAEAGTN